MQKSVREPELARVPSDLHKVLAASPKAKAQWDDLTPIARRDFISWVDSAKQQETRKRRVKSVPGRLASGKRRPCCYVARAHESLQSHRLSAEGKGTMEDSHSE